MSARKKMRCVILHDRFVKQRIRISGRLFNNPSLRGSVIRKDRERDRVPATWLEVF